MTYASMHVELIIWAKTLKHMILILNILSTSSQAERSAGLITLLDSLDDRLNQIDAKYYAWGICHRRGRGHIIALLRRATARGVQVRYVPISYLHRDAGGAATFGDVQLTERNKVGAVKQEPVDTL